MKKYRSLDESTRELTLRERAEINLGIDDCIKFGEDIIHYKFNEKNSIEELQKHIDKTYDSHYSKEKFQAAEFIIDGGHGTGFCIGNILKYAQRYGKKGSREDARKDLLKVLHYAIIQLHVHDQEL